MVVLENDQLIAEFQLHGAELVSLKNKNTGKSYLWTGDPKFWGRVSPVLFPFVGGLQDKEYRYQGKTYPMTQHGFARDMDFVLDTQTEDTVWFSLNWTEETYEKYPFRFCLKIGYTLSSQGIVVKWRVMNLDTKEMYFSIGAHPAFLCPIHPETTQQQYSLSLRDAEGQVVECFANTVLTANTLAGQETKEYATPAGILPIAADLFDGDALVIENRQVSQVGLVDETGHEYVTVKFDAPLVGIWSPPKKNAPFVCIEPWYGRCDRDGYRGELKDRQYENALAAGGIFTAQYSILVD